MILDACFLVDLMDGDEAAVAKLDELVSAGRTIGVSTLTVTGVERGLDGTVRDPFEAVVSDVDVVPYDREVAHRAATVLRTLDTEGERIGAVDAMVAATALERGTGVVTRNVSEFRRVEGLRVVPY